MPVALAVAWGCLAAVPCVFVARARPGRARAIGLVPAVVGEPARRRTAARWLRRFSDIWSARRAVARTRRTISAELPTTIDLLAVAIGAGCTPYLAVEVAAPWAPPELQRRLGSVVRACRLGADLDRALDDLAGACDDLRGLADALLAADRLGTPVLESLQQLADSARADVRRLAEARARTVPVRLLFPLVFLVLPAFGILTVVPTVAEHLAG